MRTMRADPLACLDEVTKLAGQGVFGRAGTHALDLLRTGTVGPKGTPFKHMILPIGLQGLSLYGGAKDALAQEDPTGLGRSKLRRVGDLAGDFVGGSIGYGAFAKAFPRAGLLGGLVGGGIATNLGSRLGRAVLSPRFGSQRPDRNDLLSQALPSALNQGPASAYRPRGLSFGAPA